MATSVLILSAEDNTAGCNMYSGLESGSGCFALLLRNGTESIVVMRRTWIDESCRRRLNKLWLLFLMQARLTKPRFIDGRNDTGTKTTAEPIRSLWHAEECVTVGKVGSSFLGLLDDIRIYSGDLKESDPIWK